MADISIDLAHANSAKRMHPRSLVWKNSLVGAAFYITSGGVFAYRHTSDGGQTWSSLNVISHTSRESFGFSVWHESWAEGLGTDPDIVWTISVERYSSVHYVVVRSLDLSTMTLGTRRDLYVTGSLPVDDTAVEGHDRVSVSICKTPGGSLYAGGTFYWNAAGVYRTGFLASYDNGSTWSRLSSGIWTDSDGVAQCEFVPSGDDCLVFTAGSTDPAAMRVWSHSLSAWRQTAVSAYTVSGTATTIVIGAVPLLDSGDTVAMSMVSQPSTTGYVLISWEWDGASPSYTVERVATGVTGGSTTCGVDMSANDDILGFWYGNSGEPRRIPHDMVAYTPTSAETYLEDSGYTAFGVPLVYDAGGSRRGATGFNSGDGYLYFGATSVADAVSISHTPGIFTLTSGGNVRPNAQLYVEPVSASLAAVTVVTTRQPTMAADALTLTGVAPTVQRRVSVLPGMLTLTGAAPIATKPIRPGVATLTLNGGVPRPNGILSIPPGVLTFAATTAEMGKPMPAAAGAMTLSAPSQVLSHRIAPEPGSLSLSGTTVVTARRITHSPATLSLSHGPAYRLNKQIDVAPGTLTLGGTLVRQNYGQIPFDPISYTVTAPTVLMAKVLIETPHTLSLTAPAVGITAVKNVAVAPGTLSLGHGALGDVPIFLGNVVRQKTELQVWTDTVTCYVFGLVDTGARQEPRYWKTVDGGRTWASGVSLDANNCGGLVIWYDGWSPGNTEGQYIHMAWVSSIGQVIYRRLDTITDAVGTAANVGAIASVAIGNLGVNHLTMTKNNGGSLLIGGVLSGAYVRGWYTGSGTSWSSIAEPGYPTPTGDPVQFAALPSRAGGTSYVVVTTEREAWYYDGPGDAWTQGTVDLAITWASESDLPSVGASAYQPAGTDVVGYVVANKASGGSDRLYHEVVDTFATTPANPVTATHVGTKAAVASGYGVATASDWVRDESYLATSETYSSDCYSYQSTDRGVSWDAGDQMEWSDDIAVDNVYCCPVYRTVGSVVTSGRGSMTHMPVYHNTSPSVPAGIGLWCNPQTSSRVAVQTIDPSPGTLSLGHGAARVNGILSIEADTLSLSAPAVAVRQGYSQAVVSGALALSGPAIETKRGDYAAAGTLALSAPACLLRHRISVVPGVLAFQAPSINFTSLPQKTIDMVAGTFVLSGVAINDIVPQNIRLIKFGTPTFRTANLDTVTIRQAETAAVVTDHAS